MNSIHYLAKFDTTVFAYRKAREFIAYAESGIVGYVAVLIADGALRKLWNFVWLFHAIKCWE